MHKNILIKCRFWSRDSLIWVVDIVDSQGTERLRDRYQTPVMSCYGQFQNAPPPAAAFGLPMTKMLSPPMPNRRLSSLNPALSLPVDDGPGSGLASPFDRDQTYGLHHPQNVLLPRVNIPFIFWTTPFLPRVCAMRDRQHCVLYMCMCFWVNVFVSAWVVGWGARVCACRSPCVHAHAHAQHLNVCAHRGGGRVCL